MGARPCPSGRRGQPASRAPGLLARAGPPAGTDMPAAKPPHPSPTHRPLRVHPGGGDGARLLRVSPCELLHQQHLLRESAEKSGGGGRPSAQSTGAGKPRRAPAGPDPLGGLPMGGSPWPGQTPLSSRALSGSRCPGSKAQTPSSAPEARTLTLTQPSRLMARGFGPAPGAWQMPAHHGAFVQLLPPPGPPLLPRLTLTDVTVPSAPGATFF